MQHRRQFDTLTTANCRSIREVPKLAASAFNITQESSDIIQLALGCSLACVSTDCQFKN